MSEGAFGFMIGIVVITIGVLGLNVAHGVGQDSIRKAVLSDCATFNAFAYGETVYDCKVRP